MKSRSLLVFALLAAAACGGKKPAETPAPAPAPAPIDSTAIKARMRQDSINAAEARARAAADAAARAAAQLQAQLSAEVSAMIHFDFDKADIKPEDQANLDRKAAILKANPGLSIQIAGNCDNRGSDEYNLALGNRRAAAAQRYLINQGVSASQITIVSYGEERPVNPANDEAAWAENRNDQFTPTAGGNNLVAPK
ncbi:MAG TPA: peptidoglycan-associated lipoprotein Pal [Gemmatimonadales bacterium]|nr:peptidoglycan-associated lipoprotein Pal [Gemmatimonadales bacterium]